MNQYGGMIDTFSIYINNLAIRNKNNLNLKKYENINSLQKIDMGLINKILSENQSCSYNFMTLMKFMYKNTICINADYIIDKLNKNINDIYKNYKDRIHIIYISDLYTRDKSNFFFTLYFILLYNKKFKKPIYVYSQQFNKEYIDKVYNKNKILFIVCDDFSYGGSQLNIEINKLYTQINDKYNDYSIYLNIFGYTNNALNLINKNTFKEKIIFPNFIIAYNNSVKEVFVQFIKQNNLTVENFIKKYDMFIVSINKKQLKVDSLLYSKLFYPQIKRDNINVLDTYLIYLFYKFPDYLSTYLNLCKLTIFDDNTIILNNEGVELININTLDMYHEQTFDNILKKIKINPKKHIIRCTNIEEKSGTFILKGFKQINEKINNEIIETNKEYEYCNKKLITPFYKNEFNIIEDTIYTIPLKINDKNYSFEDLYNNNVIKNVIKNESTA